VRSKQNSFSEKNQPEWTTIRQFHFRSLERGVITTGNRKLREEKILAGQESRKRGVKTCRFHGREKKTGKEARHQLFLSRIERIRVFS